MRAEIDVVLSRTGGVASRTRLLQAVSRAELDDEIRRGHLVRMFSRAYARPWCADDPQLRDRAALVSVGPPATLSHLSALRRWGLPSGADDIVHVTVGRHRHPLDQQGLRAHRTRSMPPLVRLHGLPTVAAAPAIVTSWALLPGTAARAPVITAARNRLVTPAELRDSLAGHPRAPGRRELGVLIGRLAAGCESELELWGHLEVFDVAGLRHGVRQLPIRVGTSRYRLDLAYEQERVAVELDGRAYHASPAQWERDIRRDLALATVGWQTVRLSHRRLTTDVHGCRRDVLAVLAARRPGRRGR